jgi:hypothetical protein
MFHIFADSLQKPPQTELSTLAMTTHRYSREEMINKLTLFVPALATSTLVEQRQTFC